jgi:hypothetical protein
MSESGIILSASATTHFKNDRAITSWAEIERECETLLPVSAFLKHVEV